MKNYIQEGRMITVAAPAGGVTSGDGVVMGALFGVASKTAAAGETVSLATDAIAWDNTAKQVNVPGTGRYPIGTAIEAAGNGATTVRVRLDGIATAAERARAAGWDRHCRRIGTLSRLCLAT